MNIKSSWLMLSKLSILFISFFYQICNMISRPFVPLLGLSLGADSVIIGSLIAVQSFFPLVLAIPAGRMVDLFGAKKVLFLGGLLTFLSGIFYLIAHEIWILFCAQVTSGIGMLLVWLAIQTLATQMHTEAHLRDNFVGFFGSFSATGQFLAPILGGGLADVFGYHFALGITTLLGIFIFSATFLLPKYGKTERQYQDSSWLHSYTDAFKILSQNRTIQLVMLASFVPIFGTVVRTSFLPLYLNSLRFSNTLTGLIVGFGPLAAIFCRGTMGVSIKRFSRRWVLLATIFLPALAIVLVPLFKNFFSLAFLSIVSGWGTGLNEPMGISMIAAFTQTDVRGIAMGLRLSVNRVTMFLAPLIFASLMEIYNLVGAFILNGFVLLIWNMFTVAFITRQHLGPDLGVKQDRIN